MMLTRIKNFFSDLRNGRDRAITILFWITFAMVTVSYCLFNFAGIKEVLHYPEEKYVLLEEEAEKLLQMPDLLESLVNGTATEYSYDLNFSFDESYSNVELKLKDKTAELTIVFADFESREVVFKRNSTNPVTYILLMIAAILLVLIAFTFMVFVIVALVLMFISSMFVWCCEKIKRNKH